MIPKRIRSKASLDGIEKRIRKFYINKTEDYGLMDRPESDYEHYGGVVSEWTIEDGIVLDLGCGTYRTPQLLQRSGFKTTGCDFFTESQLKAYADLVGNDGPEFKSYEGKRLPFTDESFDTVATLCLFEHIPYVEKLLQEIKRVLKRHGRLIIMGPNISGPHRIILGLKSLLFKNRRYWQFTNIIECIAGGVKLAWWTIGVMINPNPTFVYIYPLMEGGKIKFELPDDDAIQLNIPISYKKWFQKNDFILISYNRNIGDSAFTRLFNKLFPSMATKIQIVAQKKH